MVFEIILIGIVVVETALLFLWKKPPKKEINEEEEKRIKEIKKAFNELMEYDEKKARKTKW